MRRRLARVARMYPGLWRARYGEEFDALLEEVDADWRQFFDVLGGALKMQLRHGNAWKWVAALAAAGMVVAGTASFVVNQRYVSKAIVRFTPVEAGQYSPDRTAELTDLLLSRSSLAELIQKLDLYRDERSRLPLEDIVQTMRTRDLHLRAVDSMGRSDGLAFEIAFAYPDRNKAQATVSGLVEEFRQYDSDEIRNRVSMWQTLWHEPPPAALGDVFEVLDPASLPAKAIGPNHWLYLACGLAAGLLLGLVVMRRRAAFRLAGWALAGGVLAAACSYALPDAFTSTAVMRMTPAVDPERWKAQAPAELRFTRREHIERMREDILASATLERIVANPNIDLYRKRRANEPMAEVVAAMRKDLSIRFVEGPLAQGAHPATFAISFTYTDRYKAQSVVRQIVSKFSERNFDAMRASMSPAVSPEFVAMAEHGMGENLEVVDPASLPEIPQSPNRAALAAAGAAIAIALQFLIAWRRRRQIEVGAA